MQHDIDALRRRHYNATAIAVRRPTAGLLVLRLRPDTPLPEYAAGQWLPVGLGVWEERCPGCPDEALDDAREILRQPYSLSCSILADGENRLLEPPEHDYYELYIAFDRGQARGDRGAALAARLAALESGSRLWLDERPRGNYTLATVQPHDDVVFLATGTGEAPHNRMLWELLRRGHRGRIGAVVSVRHAADLAYRDVHERLMRRFPPYRWAGIETRAGSASGGRMQALLENGGLEERTGIPLDPQRCHVFLCGNAGFLGRPQQQDGAVTYPQPPGMIEFLSRRGYRIEPPAGVHVHFERD